MGNPSLQRVMRHIRQLADRRAHQSRGRKVAHRPETPESDQDLLTRYLSEQDEEAMAELVGRHGRMVRGVCQRLLDQDADRDDAFQATFLILLHKARSIRKRRSLGSWLFGVAYRIALQARAKGKQKAFAGEPGCGSSPSARSVTDTNPSSDPARQAAWRELCAILDEELHRLPDRYRGPLVLCYLAGQMQPEAAGHLGWSLRTLKRRLEQAKDIMRLRLSRRGLTLSSTLLIAGLSQQEAAAAVPLALTLATIKEATLVVAGKSTSATISANALALTQAALKSLALGKLKIVMACIVLAGLAAAGAGWAVQQLATPKLAQANVEKPPRQDVPPPAPPKPKEEKPARTDRYGDPLPEGAIARLGSLRLYHGMQMYVDRVVLAPDATRIISMTREGHRLLWDAGTGKELNLRDELKQATSFVATEDKLLAVILQKESVLLWDVMAEKETARLPLGLSSSEPIGPLGLCPKGKSLVWFSPKTGINGSTCKLNFADATKGVLLRSVTLNGDKGVVALVFSADGNALATHYSDNSLDVWDLKTHTVGMSLTLKGDGLGQMALSPDGSRLAVFIYGEKQIRFWDTHAKKELAALYFDPEMAASSVSFSPDGKFLAATSQMAVAIWDLGTRKEIQRLPGRENPSHPVISRDGKLLAAADGCGISIWNLTTGKLNHDFGHLYTVNALAFAPDRRTIASGAAYSDPVVRTWDPLTGQIKARLRGHTVGIEAIAYSPDGKLLASGSQDESVRLWDVSTGKEVGCLEAHDGMIYGMEFAPNGKTIATGGKRKAVHLWDVATRKEIRTFDNPGAFVLRVSFSPDGKMVVTRGNGDDVVRIWDVSSGKNFRSFSGLSEGCPTLSFAPDSRTLAVNCNDGTVRLLDVLTGREIRVLGEPTKPDQANRCLAAVFAPDGRSLAAAYDDVRVWEIASGRVRVRFQGHRGVPLSLAYSRDGSLLASGSSDHTAVIWDVLGDLPSRGQSNLDQKALDKLWTDLASMDAANANRAIKTLLAARQQAAPFLKERLHAAPAGDQKRIGQLIADLDKQSFAVREKASQALLEIGEAAEPALRTALAGKPSAEVHRRAEAILAQLDPTSSPARLRLLRAVEVLEHIGTPEAQEVLKTLSQGAPEARLTQEAKASLDRLAKRSLVSP